jgi:hypothetical protein
VAQDYPLSHQDATTRYSPQSLCLCPTAIAQLNGWAKAAGLKYFGTAINNPGLSNSAYMKIGNGSSLHPLLLQAAAEADPIASLYHNDFNVERCFSELVDEVACTELDIRHTKLPLTAEAREQRAKACLEVVNACPEMPMCVAITIWGFTDQEQVYLPESNACTQRRVISAGGACISLRNWPDVALNIAVLTRLPVQTAGP